MNPPTEFKYWAFISYSRQDNRKDRNLWGDWLHYALENFKVPQELFGKPGRDGELTPERLFPCFQDDKELPIKADLGEAIGEALKQSRYLVVICSPRAAKSVWVNEEVLEFKRLGRANRILAIIVDGEPNASEPGKGSDPALECFPPALRHRLGPDGNLDLAQRVEPIAADVRGSEGREASLKNKAHDPVLEREKLRVVAGLLGIGFGDLVQRDKERQLVEERAKARRLRKLAAGFAALALVATVAGILAVRGQKEAERQRKEAEHQRKEAEAKKEEALQTLSQSDFLQAVRLIAEDKDHDAVAYLVASLRANPANDAAVTRLATLLAYRAWLRPILHLRRAGLVRWAQYSPDGRRIVTASWEGTNDMARAWDAQTGQPLPQPLKHDGTFSPDGKRIVTTSSNGTNGMARVWDAQTGQPLTEPLKHARYNLVNSAQFSPDGKRVVTASGDGTARVWDAQTGQPRTEPLKHAGAVSSAQFSPDGKRVVTASADGTARVWDAQTGQPLTEPLKHPGEVQSAEFSPDGKRIMTKSGDRTARVWDAQTGQPLTEPLTQVFCIGLRPDGKRLVTVSIDNTALGWWPQGTVRVWDTQASKALTEPLKHAIVVNSAQFSPDSKRIVTASYDSTARVWDAQTGQPLTGPLRHAGGVLSAQFSPDGKRVVTASADGTARVWDAQTGQPLTEPLKHAGWVHSAQFSPDGKRVVTASEDGTRVWDAQTGQQLIGPFKHAGAVKSAQFSPEGKRLVTASDDGTAWVWDAQTGHPLTGPLKHSLALVFSAQFSPEGKRVVTASNDKTARVWDAQTGQPLTKPLEHAGQVNFAQFSPDGKWVATESADNTARVWDAQTGQPLTEPLKHAAWLQFSPDGKRVVTVSANAARVWDVAPSSAAYPGWLLELATAICGEVLNARGVLQYTNQVQALDQLRQTLSEQPGSDDWLVLGRWLLADRSTRTISPFSKVTIPEWIERRLGENTTNSLAEVEQVAIGIGDAGLLERIAQAREKLERTKRPEPAN